MNTKRSKVISLTKTCTWRVLASLDTFLLSWLITGNVKMGMGIASLEVLTKMFLYYAHERTWNVVPWAKIVAELIDPSLKDTPKAEPKKRGRKPKVA